MTAFMHKVSEMFIKIESTVHICHFGNEGNTEGGSDQIPDAVGLNHLVSSVNSHTHLCSYFLFFCKLKVKFEDIVLLQISLPRLLFSSPCVLRHCRYVAVVLNGLNIPGSCCLKIQAFAMFSFLFV